MERACASRKVGATAVTVSTRPPLARSVPSASLVPAWKTVTPAGSFAGIVIAAPFFGASGYPSAASTVVTDARSDSRTGGSGAQFIREQFAGELFGAGQPLDATKYFIVMSDGIGHGKSSKPSDGLRAKFPRYGYNDMVDAQYRLLTEGLKVNHLRLVMGTSMGGMHTWVWGERYPDFMDALLPLASLPTQISGRNRVWRKTVIDAIRNDPAWQGGNYTTQPPSLRTAASLIFFMGGNPVLRQETMQTLAQSDQVLDEYLANAVKNQDANDLLYQVSASQDYDPGPGLEKIRAPLLAINSADDLINPPELGILESEIKRVKHGEAVVIPYGPETRGHGSHTFATLWKEQLVKLLEKTGSAR